MRTFWPLALALIAGNEVFSMQQELLIESLSSIAICLQVQTEECHQLQNTIFPPE